MKFRFSWLSGFKFLNLCSNDLTPVETRVRAEDLSTPSGKAVEECPIWHICFLWHLFMRLWPLVERAELLCGPARHGTRRCHSVRGGDAIGGAGGNAGKLHHNPLGPTIMRSYLMKLLAFRLPTFTLTCCIDTALGAMKIN